MIIASEGVIICNDMVLNSKQRKQLIEVAKVVLLKVQHEDSELITRGGLERSIVFRFALYFYEYMRVNPITCHWFNHLDMDVEYGKNGLNPKRTPRRPHGTQPDFILHHRGGNNENLLVIEFKGWWNGSHRETDRIKLEDYVHQDGEYRYGLGLLVDFQEDGVPIIECF
jgi:hypothetical protein